MKPFVVACILMISLGMLHYAHTVVAHTPAPVSAGTARIYYSPQTNLQDIDVALIEGAEHTIDVASYILTSWPIMQSLARAADRGVSVRLLLDRSELTRERGSRAFDMLTARQGVQIRVKSGDELLHLKSYSVDGLTLRDGSANLTPSGLLRQTNSLIVINNSEAAAAFLQVFEKLFAGGETLQAAAAATTREYPKGWIPRERW